MIFPLPVCHSYQVGDYPCQVFHLDVFMRTNTFKGNCLCKYTLAYHSSCCCYAVVVVNISCFSLLDGYPFTCPAFFILPCLLILPPELSNVDWIQVSVCTQYGHSVSLTTLCFSPYVLKHKTTRNDIIRERRNPLVPIMCSLGAWYFLFRDQLLSLLFTPHDHSWRVQLCLESLPRSGTEESDC